MNRIDSAFKELRRRNKKALIPFITAGYPDLAMTEKLVPVLAAHGADIVELGVPFTDPMADGPVIQQASHEALNTGVTLKKILQSVRRIRRSCDVPLCLMSYYNPVFCFGQERFVRAAAAAGVDGLIIPDLPPEEASALRRTARRAGLALIFFVAPTSSSRRRRLVAAVSSGFIYYVSLTGVTGARARLPAGLASSVAGLKALTRTPVCVGFGISRPRQVRQVQRFADGAIVGSALVKVIRDNRNSPQLPNRVASFLSALKGP